MKVLVIFFLALVSKLAMVESMRNATPVTDPNPSVCNMRSKYYNGTKINSTGVIINDRHLIGVAVAIYPKPASTFAYLGSPIYNSGEIRYIEDIKIYMELALLRTNETIPFSDKIKPARAPIIGENYGNLMVDMSGFGPAVNISFRDFSYWLRGTKCQVGYVSDYKTMMNANQMPLLRNGSNVCIDKYDVGTAAFASKNGVESVVGLVLRDLMNKTCEESPTNAVAVALRLTKYVPWVRYYTTWV